jgi:LruC domain-containing protein
MKNRRTKNFAKALIPLVLLASCKKMDQVPSPSADTISMLNLSAPDGFNYEMASDVSVDISLLTNNNQPLSKVMVSILDKPSDENGKVLFTAITDENGKIKSTIKLPTYLSEVVIDPGYVGLMRNASVKVQGHGVVCTIGGSEGFGGNVVPNTGIAAPTTSSRSSRTAGIPYHYMGTFDANGRPNYLLPTNDVISARLLSYVNASLPEQKPVPTYHPTYLTNTAVTNLHVVKQSDVWITFVSEGAGYLNTLAYFTYPTNRPPASTSEIDSINIILPNGSLNGSGGTLVSGNKILLGRFEPGISIGFCLIANGWNSTTKTVGDGLNKFYSIDALNPEADPSSKRHSVLLDDQDDKIFLIGFEDRRRDNGSDEDYNDMIFYASANPVDGISNKDVNPIDKPGDKDGDGVSDVYDKFPTDPARAYINYYPGPDTYGSIAFEDTWPNTGDYDMNDLVVNYRYTTIQNGLNKTVEMFNDYVLKASGAQFRNGFGVQFPFAPSAVATATGSKVNGNSVVTLSSNGTEAGQSKAVLIPFDDIYSVMQPNSSDYINTVPNLPFVTPDTVHMKVTFTSPLTFAQLGVAPFNQFLISNRTRGKEVHLPGEKPTDKVNTALFKTMQDNTAPSLNRYYKTLNNLPWAISIPQQFDYPIEGKAVNSVYLKFVEWAQSGGVSYPNWYQSSAGLRSPYFFYKH